MEGGLEWKGGREGGRGWREGGKKRGREAGDGGRQGLEVGLGWKGGRKGKEVKPTSWSKANLGDHKGDFIYQLTFICCHSIFLQSLCHLGNFNVTFAASIIGAYIRK